MDSAARSPCSMQLRPLSERAQRVQSRQRVSFHTVSFREKPTNPLNVWGLKFAVWVVPVLGFAFGTSLERRGASDPPNLRVSLLRGLQGYRASCWSLLLDVDCCPPEEKGIRQAGELLQRVRAEQLFFEQFVPRSHRPYNQPFQSRRKDKLS